MKLPVNVCPFLKQRSRSRRRRTKIKKQPDDISGLLFYLDKDKHFPVTGSEGPGNSRLAALQCRCCFIFGDGRLFRMPVRK